MSNHSERRGSRDSLATWFGGQIVSRGCDQFRGSGGPLPGSLMQLLAEGSSVSLYSNGISTAEPQDRNIG